MRFFNLIAFLLPTSTGRRTGVRSGYDMDMGEVPPMASGDAHHRKIVAEQLRKLYRTMDDMNAAQMQNSYDIEDPYTDVIEDPNVPPRNAYLQEGEELRGANYNHMQLTPRGAMAGMMRPGMRMGGPGSRFAPARPRRNIAQEVYIILTIVILFYHIAFILLCCSNCCCGRRNQSGINWEIRGLPPCGFTICNGCCFRWWFPNRFCCKNCLDGLTCRAYFRRRFADDGDESSGDE